MNNAVTCQALFRNAIFFGVLLACAGSGWSQPEATTLAQTDDVPTAIKKRLNDKAEVGKLELSYLGGTGWVTVELLQTYTEPIVIAQPLSFADPEPATVRISEVGPNSFRIRIQEWNYLDGSHGGETVSYIVAEAGDLTLGGLAAVAGKAEVNHNWQAVNLGLTSSPIVFSQSQTMNGGSAVVTRQRNVLRSSFEVKLQEEEGQDGTHAVEEVAYLAVEQGAADGLEVLTAASKNDNWVDVAFNGQYSAPLLLAGIQGFAGGDTAALRYRSLEQHSVQLKVEEEASEDDELNHADEVLGIFVIEGQAAE